MKKAIIAGIMVATILMVGCSKKSPSSSITPPPGSKSVAVASLPGNTSDKVLSQISHVLGGAGISCDISRGAFGSEPARYNIQVPADKKAEAASLLKQDAANQKYELKVY
jgi:major membrane immunogen (membrane-anchored lipoprotein)